METKPKPKILICGTGDALKDEFVQLSDKFETIYFSDRSKFEDHMLDITDDTYSMLVCGDAFGSVFSNEFAQVLRQSCTSPPLYLITKNKNEFNQTAAKKNGFTDVLLWPTDKSLLLDRLYELEVSFGNKKIAYKQIYTADLTTDVTLPFSTYVFLPLNNKHVMFSSSGNPIKSEKIEKLNKKEFSKVYIDKKETQNFYKYTADNLKRNLNQLSETERKDQVQNTVRGLFSHLFDSTSDSSFEGGKDALADCQKIVSSYVTSGRTDNWYAQLVKNLGGAMNAYDHAATVSSVAALIAIGIGHEKPEDLALAGFFHDIGRADFDEAWLTKPAKEWPDDVVQDYQKHCLVGVNLLKEKKIILPHAVEKAILQHHERYDGKGFPKQLEGERITEDAQILSLADQFSYLSIEIAGQEKKTPEAIFELIKSNGSIGPALLSKVSKLFKVS